MHLSRKIINLKQNPRPLPPIITDQTSISGENTLPLFHQNNNSQKNHKSYFMGSNSIQNTLSTIEQKQLNDKLLSFVKEGNIEDTGLAIKKGADVNARGQDGITSLMHAIKFHKTQIVKLLLDTKGIDVDAQSVEGVTAFGIAALEGNDEIIKLLIHFKPYPHVPASNKTTISQHIKEKYAKICKIPSDKNNLKQCTENNTIKLLYDYIISVSSPEYTDEIRKCIEPEGDFPADVFDIIHDYMFIEKPKEKQEPKPLPEDFLSAP